jgi:hypothetical protein
MISVERSREIIRRNAERSRAHALLMKSADVYDAAMAQAQRSAYEAWRSSVLRSVSVFKAAVSDGPFTATNAQAVVKYVNRAALEAASAEMSVRMSTDAFDPRAPFLVKRDDFAALAERAGYFYRSTDQDGTHVFKRADRVLLVDEDREWAMLKSGRPLASGHSVLDLEKYFSEGEWV